MPYTTANLISNIERRSFMPVNQSTFDAAEVLAMAYEELTTWIWPAIVKQREEYFIWEDDQSITINIKEYDIPVRCYNSTVREVKKIINNEVINLDLMEVTDIQSTLTGIPTDFYFRSEKICLYPTPVSTLGTLRQFYVLSPGEYIETDDNVDYAVISAINTSTNVVSVSSIPSAWATSDIFDFVRKDAGHEYRGIDYTSTLVSGTDITFGSLPDNLAVGDYVMPVGYSSLVQMPRSFRNVLAQLAAASLLESANQPGAKTARDKGMGMLQVTLDSITPRVQGENKFIVHDWF